MTEKETNPNQAADLRREAENITRENADQSPEDLQAMSHEEIRHALHELRVHQIELEMQNSVLHRAQLELEESHARYFDLYDLAPVGYATVSENGLMIEANLTAAMMLGVARGVPGLAHPIFSQFIHIEDQDIYYLFRKQLFKTTGKPQACDLRMVKKDGPVFWAHLEATVAQDPSTGSLQPRPAETGQAGKPVIRMVISDISAEQNLKETRNLLEQMVEERAKQLRQQTDAPSADGADTILLVDDEPHVLSALIRILRNSPYQVLTAGSAGEALKIMESTNIKVIVSDEMMVGMRGSELLAEVQRRFPHTLRMLLTGHATLESSMRAMNEGQVYRFLTKPWDDGMLRLALSAAIEKYNFDAARRRSQDALRESEEKYRVLFEGMNDAVFVNDFGEDGLSGRFLQVNDIARRRLGYTREELLSLTPRDITIPDEYERIADKRIGLASHGDILVETIHVTKDGRKIPVESNIRQVKYLGRQVALSISRDITDRKQAEEYREMRQEVLSILNELEDSPDSMQRVLTVLKARTGCSAVAIRLQEGEDFPYFAQDGFSDDFLQTENMLISRAADGQMCRDKEGNVRLECTCGLVIDGRTDPSSPFFTRGGSFWTNDSFPLLDLPSDQDPRHHPRNQCTHHGYASFVLVPLRNKGRAIGLIQITGRRKGHFTLETVEHLEGIAAHIGAALVRRQAEEALQEAHDLLEQRVEERTKELRE
ncbi:MAG: PAS domain S-box protein, partial [Syntrophales bacterium]